LRLEITLVSVEITFGRFAIALFFHLEGASSQNTGETPPQNEYYFRCIAQIIQNQFYLTLKSCAKKIKKKRIHNILKKKTKLKSNFSQINLIANFSNFSCNKRICVLINGSEDIIVT
jgi:hypothetical protein